MGIERNLQLHCFVSSVLQLLVISDFILLIKDILQGMSDFYNLYI